MSRRTEHSEQSMIDVEVQSPGVHADDDGESDVLVLDTEGVELRIYGNLDNFLARVNEAIKKQGWDGL